MRPLRVIAIPIIPGRGRAMGIARAHLKMCAHSTHPTFCARPSDSVWTRYSSLTPLLAGELGLLLLPALAKRGEHTRAVNANAGQPCSPAQLGDFTARRFRATR